MSNQENNLELQGKFTEIRKRRKREKLLLEENYFGLIYVNIRLLFKEI